MEPLLEGHSNLILGKTETATAAAGPDAAGFVLAGGQSSRMGMDKALIRFGGRPLVERALAVLRETGLEAFIAGARSSLAGFAPVVEDAEPGRGPMGGICAALAWTSARWAVFIPVDLPLMPASLVAFMLDHARMTGRVVTVASINGYAQTFPAVVDRATLPALLNELKAGRGGCFSGFQAAAARMGEALTVLAVESLVQSGHVAQAHGLPAFAWFQSINSPADLGRAEARAEHLDRVT
jgi:molybdopterin-guanine dinucleotide biosynthesis protein A